MTGTQALSILCLLYTTALFLIVFFMWVGSIFLEWFVISDEPLLTIFKKHINRLRRLRIV